MQETTLGFIELTPAQYAARISTPDNPVSESTIRRRCEEGLLDAYKAGTHWKIRVRKEENVVSQEKYEALLRENTELRTKLDIARKALA